MMPFSTEVMEAAARVFDWARRHVADDLKPNQRKAIGDIYDVSRAVINFEAATPTPDATLVAAAREAVEELRRIADPRAPREDHPMRCISNVADALAAALDAYEKGGAS